MCGNGCKCAKADMTVEEVVEPGTVVEVPCGQCDATGENKFNIRSETGCWRCDGTGTQKCVTEPRNCPNPECGISHVSDQIAKEHMGSYGATHFGSEMGIYRFDSTVAYTCQTCGTYFSRFDRTKILTKEQVLHGTYQELMPR